ncbi:MAG: hypothetical protein IKG21_13360 [Atopobiaceae bacterium]|nr:hypothetical protein [Atopobiaceae bacterium]
MKCPRCNVDVECGQRFCPNCGFYIEDIVEEPAFEPAPEDEFDEEDAPTYEDEQEVAVEFEAELEQDVPLEDEVEPEPEPALELVQEPEPAELPESTAVAPTAAAAASASSQSQQSEPTFYDDYGYYDYEYDVDSEDVSGIEVEAHVVRLDDDEDPYVRASAYERGGLRGLIRRWRAVLLVAACIIALVIAGISSMRWNENQEVVEAQAAAAAEAELHRVVEVIVGLDVPMYDEAHMTNAPLRVVGSTAKGEAVDQLYVLHPTRDVLKLEKGSYIVSCDGPILSDTGALYNGSVDSFALSIADDVSTVNGQPVNLLAGAAFSFLYRQAEPKNITDSELDAARAWMLEAEIVNYQAYTDAVIQKRQEALDQYAAEQAKREEEERKAAEDAARDAEAKKKEEEEKQKQKDTTTNPDGSTSTTTQNDDGSTTTVTTNSDGSTTTVTKYPDGTSTTVKKSADGTITTTDADGLITVTNPDGTSYAAGVATDTATTSTSASTTSTENYGNYDTGYDSTYGSNYGYGYDTSYGYDTGYGYDTSGNGYDAYDGTY